MLRGRVHRAARLLDRVLLNHRPAVLELVADRGHRDAAQIGFFAVLSAIPPAMLLVGAFGLVFDEAEVRGQVITTAFDSVPLVQDAERAVADALDDVGRIGPVSVLLLIGHCCSSSSPRPTSPSSAGFASRLPTTDAEVHARVAAGRRRIREHLPHR